MYLKKTIILTLLCYLSTTVLSYAFSKDDILGYWLSKKKTGIVEIYKDHNQFEGKLVWIKDDNGQKAAKLDTKNSKNLSSTLQKTS